MHAKHQPAKENTRLSPSICLGTAVGGWSKQVHNRIGERITVRILCPSFGMCAHVNGEDFVRREPGFSANQFGLA